MQYEKLPVQWQYFVDLISDNDFEADRLSRILSKQIKKIEECNKNLKKPNDGTGTLPGDQNQPITPQLDNLLHKLTIEKNMEQNAKDKKATSKSRQKNDDLKESGKDNPILIGQSQDGETRTFLEKVAGFFKPKTDQVQIPEDQVVGNKTKPKKAPTEALPPQVKFDRYLHDDGFYYKNNRKFVVETFFDDLNYGDVVMKFSNDEAKIGPRLNLAPSMAFIRAFQIFTDKINIYSDQKEITA
jgi:hypothetical protein